MTVPIEVDKSDHRLKYPPPIIFASFEHAAIRVRQKDFKVKEGEIQSIVLNVYHFLAYHSEEHARKYPVEKQTLKVGDTFSLPSYYKRKHYSIEGGGKRRYHFQLVNIVPPNPKTKVLGWIELKPMPHENKDSKEKLPTNK